jgi:DNA invertase Pin-like site-specific DNA recombinase
MKYAVAYTRVSGRTQATDGTGLDEQRAQIETWAQVHGYTVGEWFSDPGVSGELPWSKRGGMVALIERVAATGVDAVIAADLSRIGRGEQRIFDDIIELLEQKADVYTVAEGRITSKPIAEENEFACIDRGMVLDIRKAIIRAEKRKLVAKMRLGRIRKKGRGEHCDGQYRYGAHPNKPDEVRVLNAMKHMRDIEQRSFDAIAGTLNAQGTHPRRALLWTPWAVNKILKRGVQ